MHKIYCQYVFYYESTFINDLFHKLKYKWAVFLRQDFKTVGFLLWIKKKKTDIVYWNESFLYEVWNQKAIINLPLVYVSDWTSERHNLAVVENLICVCWSVPGAPSMETFLKFLTSGGSPPTEAWEIKGGQKHWERENDKYTNTPTSLIGYASLCWS